MSQPAAPARARVLITRPAAEAAQWVQKLSALGLDARALPLIDIVGEPAGVAPVLPPDALAAYAAVMFVSGQAVRHGLPRASAEPISGAMLSAAGTRAWSPGPGTSQALRDHGWPAECIDEPAPDAAQFDSEALWARVAPQVQRGSRVLIVRGGDAQGRSAGRAWLADRLRAAGVGVDEVVAYRRLAPVLDEDQRALARNSATDGSVWLFSSSEAIANLMAALPEQAWHAARAVATHPRIAQAARAAGFGDVRPAHPTLQAVAASIESFQ